MTLPKLSECLAHDDVFDIIEDFEDGPAAAAKKRWRVLVIDDDPEVHAATNFALSSATIVGRPLELLSAFSAVDGKKILEQNPDVAVILLDVVMEEHDAGLKFVGWMRRRGFDKQRIILRTGQPGYAPELDIIRDYDINDYRAKGELTHTRLITALTTAIRTFEQLLVVEDQRQELEYFAYALAHDFMQTTRQIKIFSDIIAGSHAIAGDVTTMHALSYLSGAARRLSALVDVISQYTLLGRAPETEYVNLENVFADVQAGVAPILTDTGGELSFTGTGACLGNAALIVQVLQILIANGLQHNDSGAPLVEVSVSLDRGQCTLTVSDNGIGIDSNYLEEIFKPHMRLRTSSNLPGTGLGLTLTRRAVEFAGGSISCESAPGIGSLFRVSFPVKAPRL